MELTIWQLKWCIVNIIQIYFLFLCLFELLHIVLINHLFFRKNEKTMMSKVLFSFTQTGFSTTHETSVTTVQNFYCLFPIFLDPCCTVKLAFFCPTITKPRKDYIYAKIKFNHQMIQISGRLFRLMFLFNICWIQIGWCIFCLYHT